MDKALRASSPKLLFVAVVPSVSTTEASDTINVIQGQVWQLDFHNCK